MGIINKYLDDKDYSIIICLNIIKEVEMLLEFIVENFMSFKDKTTFSMLAASKKSKDELDGAIIDINKASLLKSVAIYGANASGKSNLLKAISFIKKKILDKGKIPDNYYYKLDISCKNKPTTFEITFMANNLTKISKQKNIELRYGFQIKENKIIAEWLFGRFTAQESMLFIRENDIFNFGTKFSEGKKVYKALGSINSEYLFVKLMNDIKGDKDNITSMLVNWFEAVHDITGIKDLAFWPITSKMCQDDAFKRKLVMMLKIADVGIIDFNEIKEDHNLNDRGEEISRKSIKLKTIHNQYNGGDLLSDKVEFDFLKEESQGTQKFFSILGPILQAMKKSQVLIIDELDARLHPMLVTTIIQLFNSKLNTSNAQLICTVHNAILLNNDILRRDQIYIVDKSKAGTSSLYSLSDIENYRKDAIFSKDYLLGKLGGVPYIGNIESIFDQE
jgi:AAA15 family ATPase/GTPase